MALPSGPLTVHPANPRVFANAEGKAVLLTGSHTWGTMQDMWLETKAERITDYSGFLTMMQDYGHNFLRFWQWMHPKNAPWSDTPTIFTPQPFERTPDGRFDLSKISPGYLERLRSRVIEAGEKGIYVSVMLFEGWTIKWAHPHDNPWTFHPFNPANNVNGITDNAVVGPEGQAWDFFSLNCPQMLAFQEGYVRAIVDKLHDLPHVLYEICNEVPWRPEAMAWSEHMVSAIRRFESGLPVKHLVGITAEGGEQDNEDLFKSNADWISPSNGSRFEWRYNPPMADGRKIVVNDTDHLWGHGCDPIWTWKSFLRGHHPIFMDPWEPIPDDLSWWKDRGLSKNVRYYHAWDPMRRSMGLVLSVASRLDLGSALPSLTRCTSGYALEEGKRAFVCLFPAGGFEGLDLWDAPGNYRVTWLHPTKGETYDGGTLAGGNRHAVEAPFEGPSVLILERAT